MALDPFLKRQPRHPRAIKVSAKKFDILFFSDNSKAVRKLARILAFVLSDNRKAADGKNAWILVSFHGNRKAAWNNAWVSMFLSDNRKTASKPWRNLAFLCLTIAKPLPKMLEIQRYFVWQSQGRYQKMLNFQISLSDNRKAAAKNVRLSAFLFPTIHLIFLQLEGRYQNWTTFVLIDCWQSQGRCQQY